jgi:transcriptional regulator with XRE-family HTH domain
MHQPPTTYSVDGAAICSKRMNAGLGVQQLAEVVGISDNYLRKLERGDRKHLSPSYYVRLRAALEATDQELLAPTEEPP